jgi:predicted DNA-binding transcriptional regulator YafY
MAATNGRYYLIANTDDHDNISHYRIDKITEIKMLDVPVNPKRNISEFANGFNLPKHMAEHIYMFGGKSIWVKFWTYDFMVDSLVDWFGKDFKILEKIDSKILINVKVNETAIKFWVMQYGEYIEIVEPLSLREEIFKTAEKIMNAHS